MILFVGEQQAGHFVEEVAKDSVIFTGTILHVAETEELILAKPYSHIIIDLRQFIDSPSQIATELARIQKGYSNGQFVFFAIGYTAYSTLIRSLIDQNFSYFVLDPVLGRAKQELSKILSGYASIELPEKEQLEAKEEGSALVFPGQKSIAVAGCCRRIGTTTQALQICRYLMLKGKKACYISLFGNDIAIWKNILDGIEITEEDKSLGRFRPYGIDMYEPDKIVQIKSMSYDYLVYDFGDIHQKEFNSIQFLEKDIRIAVCGIKPVEIMATKELYSSLVSDSTSFIFSFIADDDKQSVLSLQGALSEKTVFAAYTPDPFVYTIKSNAIYDPIISVEGEAGSKSGKSKTPLKFLRRKGRVS